MIPKEKAEDLFYKMLKNSISTSDKSALFRAKQNALIAVDEVLETLDSPPIRTGNESHMLWKATVDYWKEVKQEIDKL